MKQTFNQAFYQYLNLGVTWPLTHKKKLLAALIRIVTKTLLSKEILNRYCKVLQCVTYNIIILIFHLRNGFQEVLNFS